MNNFTTIKSALAITCISFSSCFPMFSGNMVGGGNGDAITPSGDVIEKSYSINDVVNKTQLKNGTLIITQVDAEEQEALIIKAHENIMPLLEPSLNRDCLLLGLNGNDRINGNPIIQYHLKVKSLNSIQISESGVIRFDTNFEVPSLCLAMSGNGNLQVKGLVVSDLSIQISGNGRVSIGTLTCDVLSEQISGNGSISFQGGIAKKQKIKISGNGSISSSQLGGGTCSISISGNGSATVNIDDELYVTASSEDCVTNYGKATMEYEPIISNQGNVFVSVNGRQVVSQSISNVHSSGSVRIVMNGSSVTYNGKRIS